MKTEQYQDLINISERGEKILLAARNLFLNIGYDETSLQMIINESGGSRRNIYSEFGNKEGLLIAVIREQVNTQVSRLHDINYDLPPEQALARVCREFITGLLSETLVALYRLVVNIVPRLPEVGELIYQYGPLTGSKPVSDYLDHLNEQGILTIDNTDFAAKLLLEMVKGQLHLRSILVPKDKISKLEIVQHIDKTISIFLRAYRN
ncbi:MAG: TetR/AcrR family transcriptional regulator [Kangiellaceae bacterium]|nr:TetR/AcrR family transcriptional regulator [Kangiellaceae bacterium]